MSRAYKIHNPDGLYFISFAPIAIGAAWVVPIAIGITRIEYREIVIDSLSFCQRENDCCYMLGA
jgi:hypothetical protein